MTKAPVCSAIVWHYCHPFGSEIDAVAREVLPTLFLVLLDQYLSNEATIIVLRELCVLIVAFIYIGGEKPPVTLRQI